MKIIALILLFTFLFCYSFINPAVAYTNNNPNKLQGLFSRKTIAKPPVRGAAPIKMPVKDNNANSCSINSKCTIK